MPPPLLAYGVPFEDQMDFTKQCAFMLQLNTSLLETEGHQGKKHGRAEGDNEGQKPDVQVWKSARNFMG